MSPVSFRRSAGAVAAALIAAWVAVAPAAAPAKSVRSPALTPHSTYLALGDSVTFGYEEPTVVPAPDYPDAASFINYPQIVGEHLHLKVVNLACPGETSASLISTTAPSNNCENGPAPGPDYRTTYPLHVKYSGAQLAYAVKYLKSHDDVRLVSLMIGANDLFLCQRTTSDGCASELAATIVKDKRDIHTILSTLRHKARYDGQIVVVDYYSLDYAVAGVNALSQAGDNALNSEGRAFGAEIANAYASFGTASIHSGDDTCTAGLLTQLGAPGTCGVHPSVAGQALLASTVESAVHIG